MFTHYLKIAFRNIKRQKTITLINIAGLAVGLAAVFVILHYVLYETGYDRFHTRRDRIYRVVSEDRIFEAVTPYAPFLAGPALKEEIPEIEEVSRIRRLFMTRVQRGDEWEDVRAFVSVDPSIFNILTVEFILGDPKTVLSDPGGVVISESMASRWFPDEIPIGRSITIKNRAGKKDLRITGVFRDIPERSIFRAEAITSIELGKAHLQSYYASSGVRPNESWMSPHYSTFVLLKEGSAPDAVATKLAAFTERHKDERRPLIYGLQGLRDIYFHSNHMMNHPFPEGNLQGLYLFSVIAFLILVMACVNFILLSTARSTLRTREVGMRKVVGAQRSQLIGQIMTESVFLAFLSLPFAMVLSALFLPALNEFLRKKLIIDYAGNHLYILFLFGITLILGLVSGSYTSIHLSRLKPIEMIRTRVGSVVNKSVLRRALIVFQLIIFVSLLSSTFIISRQLSFSKHLDYGFDMNGLLAIDLTGKEFVEKYRPFKAELEQEVSILGVSAASVLPPSNSYAVSKWKRVDDPERDVEIESISVDSDFIETMGFSLVGGRGFNENLRGEDRRNVILNQTAVEALGIQEPAGQLLYDERIVIGVVRDFHVHSVHHEIPPIAFHLSEDRYLYSVVVRLRPERTEEGMAAVKRVWERFSPDHPIETYFLQDTYQWLYRRDIVFNRMIKRFTGLAVFVACLGLFGLSLFMAERRLREIGIRKVFGADLASILTLLSKELVLLVCIAAVISVPIVWIAMERWLQDFVFRIRISPFTFLLTAVFAMGVSWFSVGFQTVRAALTNPVDVLRYE